MGPERHRRVDSERNDEFAAEQHQESEEHKEIADDSDLWDVVVGCDVYDAERTAYGKIVELEMDTVGRPSHATVALSDNQRSRVSMPLSWIGIVGPGWVILDRTSDNIEPGSPRF